MGQESQLYAPVVRATLTAPVKGAPERRVYARVQVFSRDGVLFATPLTSQSSGALTSMLSANGLAVIGEGGRADAGADVDVVLLSLPAQSAGLKL